MKGSPQGQFSLSTGMLLHADLHMCLDRVWTGAVEFPLHP